MNSHTRAGAGAALAVGLFVLGCGGGGRRDAQTIPADSSVGTYRAEYANPAGEVRRFRVQLFAALPDRLHAEVLSPVGTTEAIIDGGGGRVALSMPRRKQAWVGEADASAMESLVGLPLTLREVVGALLGLDAPARSFEVRRSREDPGFLPSTLEIEAGGGRLSLRLKRVRPFRGDPATLGRGEPAPGMERLPLGELRDSKTPLLVVAGGEDP